MAKKIDREIMTISEAAEYMGFSVDSMYQYAGDGTLPAFKLGNRWRFRKSSLDARIKELEESQ